MLLPRNWWPYHMLHVSPCCARCPLVNLGPVCPLRLMVGPHTGQTVFGRPAGLNRQDAFARSTPSVTHLHLRLLCKCLSLMCVQHSYKLWWIFSMMQHSSYWLWYWTFVFHGEFLYLTAKSYSSISRPLLVFELSLCGTGNIQIYLEALAHIEVRWGDGP